MDTATSSEQPSMTPQQRALSDPSKSALDTYRNFVVGESSWMFWLHYELVTTLFSGLPGILGFGARAALYPALFRRCGKRPAIGRGIVVRNPAVMSFGNSVMIDDYAHHPTEIAACLNSVKALYPDEKITAVFQPHLFSRTRDFIDDFAKSLAIADELYLLDIYPARELPMEGVTSDWLLSKIDLKDKQVISKADLVQVIGTRKPKLLVTMGAGDIDLLLNDLKLSLS